MLASATGGSVCAAIATRSWAYALVFILCAVTLMVLEREQIEEEDLEELELTPEPAECPWPTPKEEGMRIPDIIADGIRALAQTETTKYVAEEGKPFYEQGLKDGAAEFAKFLLDEMESE